MELLCIERSSRKPGPIVRPGVRFREAMRNCKSLRGVPSLGRPSFRDSLFVTFAGVLMLGGSSELMGVEGVLLSTIGLSALV